MLRAQGSNADLPTVAIVIPALNEASRLGRLLEAVESQTYPAITAVIVVDGGSTDDSRRIAVQHGATVLENPERRQAAGMNVALWSTDADVIVRLDARATPERDYVDACVAALRRTGAAVVGGAQIPVGDTPVERGIARAMACPIGAGTAKFRRRNRSGWTDTVYLGAYWSCDARAVGGYQPWKKTNEDAEFAARMAALRGVWLDADIRSTYVPRSSLRALAEQYFYYGLGRAESLVETPMSVSPRQLAAPALVVALMLPVRWRVLVRYAAIMIAAAGCCCDELDEIPGFIAAAPLMHIPWGGGFIVGLAKGPVTKVVKRCRSGPR